MKRGPDEGWRRFVMEGMAQPATSLPPAPLTTGVEQQPLSFPEHQPKFDVIDGLPAAAADKLRALRQRSADLHALCVPFSELNEASIARVAAENELKRLTGSPQDFGYSVPPDDPRCLRAQKHLDKMIADETRLDERSETRAAAWRTASQALAACEVWLRDGRPHGVVLQDYDGEVPKVAKGLGLLDAIENRRRRVRELRADLHRIESAPFPSSYAKQRMVEMVEQLAQRGAVGVSRLVELDGDFEFPTQRVTSQVLGAQDRTLAFTEVPDTVALICWLDPEAMKKRLSAEIDSEADDGAALTHEARQKAEAEILSDILANDRDEAALTWKAMDERLPIEFRPDISPLALLGLRLITAPHASGRGSSPGVSWEIPMPGAGRR